MLRRFFFAIYLAGIVAASVQAADSHLNPQFAAWLNTQTNIQSWSADCVQTRRLKAIVQPLTATGHVWFAAPNRFRWELGRPPQTIAVRGETELLILYPRLKRVERFPLTGTQAGPWRDALSLLEAGFPRSQADLEARYNITSQRITDHRGEVVLQPKAEAARRMIPQLKITFDTQNSSLVATELQFADGSTMSNEFKNAVLNAQIEPSTFAPEIPKDYKVSEPLKSR